MKKVDINKAFGNTFIDAKTVDGLTIVDGHVINQWNNVSQLTK
jgi:hypothetical protein